MNIQVQPGIPGATEPCLFKAGQFVRVKGGEKVGRVIEDTPSEGGFTRVQMFDDPEGFWGPGGKTSFGTGCLTLLVDAAPSLDIDLIKEKLMKLIAVSDLAEDVGTLEMVSEENLRSHLRLIGSITADTTCDLLDLF
jgi:hypothetical protein